MILTKTGWFDEKDQRFRYALSSPVTANCLFGAIAAHLNLNLDVNSFNLVTKSMK
jgi:hypothetical protein